jgi:hypothetical protein
VKHRKEIKKNAKEIGVGFMGFSLAIARWLEDGPRKPLMTEVFALN